SGATLGNRLPRRSPAGFVGLVSTPSSPLELHPDRLLPADPALRGVARRLYESVRDLPIISPHGHVPAEWIAQDTPFRDPTSLLITPDHYITRMLHAHGRSEEHTSELQSRFELVCRLLLEKKKKSVKNTHTKSKK